MEIDVVKVVGAVTRKVVRRDYEGKPAATVIATRVLKSEIEDVWDALTTAERIPRWFLPISGDLCLGGRYQLEGHAGGEITACDPPESFEATWESGGEVTWLKVRLRSEGEATRFELQHIAHMDSERWEQFGPGAVGVGWDMLLMALDLHLASGETVDSAAAEAWIASAPGKQFARACAYSWGAAAIASGDDVNAAIAAANRTTAAYTGEGEASEAGS